MSGLGHCWSQKSYAFIIRQLFFLFARRNGAQRGSRDWPRPAMAHELYVAFRKGEACTRNTGLRITRIALSHLHIAQMWYQAIRDGLLDSQSSNKSARSFADSKDKLIPRQTEEKRHGAAKENCREMRIVMQDYVELHCKTEGRKFAGEVARNR